MAKILQPILSAIFIFSYSILTAQLTASQINISSAKQQQVFTSNSETPSKIKGLRVGNQVPDIEFSMRNYIKADAKLSDFKGRLIILDFWATWCYSCMASYPKLYEFQKKFGDKIQILLVNSVQSGDKITAVESYLKRMKIPGTTEFLPTAVFDSVAVKYFPHFVLPHYVWITPSGVLKAVTDSKDVTEENIRKIIDDENVELGLPLKKDYFPDQLMAFSVDEQVTVEPSIFHYSILKKGKIEGLSAMEDVQYDKIQNNIRNKRGLAVRNLPLLDIYEYVLFYNWKYKDYTRKRLILENIKDSTIFFFDSVKTNLDEWERKNLFTYNVIIPEWEQNNFFNYILNDLNTGSGYNARIEKRKSKCLILRELPRDKQPKGLKKTLPNDEFESTILDGKQYIKNATTGYLTTALDKMPQIKLSVINGAESYFIGNLVLDNIYTLDVEGVNKILYSIGLTLVESEKELNMFIVSNKR